MAHLPYVTVELSRLHLPSGISSFPYTRVPYTNVVSAIIRLTHYSWQIGAKEDEGDDNEENTEGDKSGDTEYDVRERGW